MKPGESNGEGLIDMTHTGRNNIEKEESSAIEKNSLNDLK
jgi:hypothetical protein